MLRKSFLSLTIVASLFVVKSASAYDFKSFFCQKIFNKEVLVTCVSGICAYQNGKVLLDKYRESSSKGNFINSNKQNLAIFSLYNVFFVACGFAAIKKFRS